MYILKILVWTEGMRGFSNILCFNNQGQIITAKMFMMINIA